MILDITKDVEYNNLLIEVFNCQDIMKLSTMVDELKEILIISENRTESLRIIRLIPSIEIRILQLNMDLSKYN